MKATINGIEVEGTPREIHELMVEMGPVKLSVGTTTGTLTDQTGVFVKIPASNTNNSTKKCTGPCYCTGECTNAGVTDRYNYAFEQLIQGYEKAAGRESIAYKLLK